MNRACFLPVVILALLSCGCISANPSPSGEPSGAVSPAAPDLLGTWTGTTISYDQEIGSANSGNISVTMIISNQKGRFFTGSLEWWANGNRSTIPVAGIIGRDGRTFTMLENRNEYVFGEILATDEIELANLNTGSSGMISIDSLKRQ